MASSAIHLPKFQSDHQLGLKDPSGRVSFRHMSLTFVNAEGLSASRGACLAMVLQSWKGGTTSPMPPTLLSTIFAQGYSVGGKVVWGGAASYNLKPEEEDTQDPAYWRLVPLEIAPTGKCFEFSSK